MVQYLWLSLIHISFANAYVSLANKEDFSYKLETRNTAGSAANVRLLSGKYIELGIAQADLVEEAYHLSLIHISAVMTHFSRQSV